MIYLAGHNNNGRDIIQNIFSPMVGVFTSPMADEICQKNNLTFVELLQPFSKLTTDSVFRDVTGTTVSMRGLRLNFCDTEYRPPQAVLARKMLNESVTNAPISKTKIIKKGKIELEIPLAEPWFENWRETFLSVQFPAEHEFTRHMLSCLIVLSSADPNIIETATKMTQQIKQIQSVIPQKLPKWFQPNDVLNSYVVLHENSHDDDLLQAQQRYELLKSSFNDSKCFLLTTNSNLNVNPPAASVTNYWQSYVKKQPKMDTHAHHVSNEQLSKDNISMISMPAMKINANLPIDATSITSTDSDVHILHPLSPELTFATDTLHSNFSVSSESLANQQNMMKSQGSNMDISVETQLVYGACLNTNDVENLRHFVQDYAVRALIPYVERLVANLNEAITNKKGVSKSLLSATKRWFVTSKPGAGTNNQNAVIYTYESTELQTRRLGDLYFMFGHYNLAFQAYHQAKRDFNAESAWQYYAGALEMAAVSAFMLGTANRKTYDYMENAIICYMTVCKIQQLAIRATLLSIECLKAANLHGEAAKQLIRMTSEDSDLRSALLVEQASYCFLACQPRMFRKYAFHIVLAGNHYSLAGQRKHAYRCYYQAHQVFERLNWSLAEDHILYTMAKHAYSLKRLEEASRCYSALLRSGSLQNAQQIIVFLKDYVQIQNEYLMREPEVGILIHATPQLAENSVRVLVAAQPCISYPLQVPASNIDINCNLNEEYIWRKIEELVVNIAEDNRPFVFKFTQSLFTKQHPGTEQPIAVQGESILLSATFVNNLKCKIVMSAVELLWKLQLENGTELSNVSLHDAKQNTEIAAAAVHAAVQNIIIPSVELEELQSATLCFKLTPKLSGKLSILGVVSTVAPASEQHMKLPGAIYFQSDKTTQSYTENILNMQVVPALPLLNVSFNNLPQNVLTGEVLTVQMALCNQGIVPIEEVYVACDDPCSFTLQDKKGDTPSFVLNALRDEPQEKSIKDLRRQHVYTLIKPNVNVLESQGVLNIPFWIHAPYEAGEFTLRLLFYYSIPMKSAKPQSRLKYRLIRHEWKFNVHSCVNANAACVVNNALTGELSLDLSVQNEHVQSELYISSLNLYSTHFLLNSQKLHVINESGLVKGKLDDNCLPTGKSGCFLVPLEARPHIISGLSANDANSVINDEVEILIKQRISRRNLAAFKITQPLPVLELHSPYSFLFKNERSIINNNENEVMRLISDDMNVSTVVVNWTALLLPNEKSEQRLVHGQHFFPLQKLNVTVSANQQLLPITAHQLQKDLPNISDLYLRDNKSYKQICYYEDNLDDDINWQLNTQTVSQRCLLEDSNYVTTIKA